MGQSEKGDFPSLIKQHTVAVDSDSASDYLFNHGARNVFLKVIVSGDTLGLSSKDVETIRKIALRQGGREAIQPYYDELAAKIDDEDVVYLAQLLEKAVDAEAKANARFFEDALLNLSSKGQQVISDAIAAESSATNIRKTYFSRIAEDAPRRMHHWLREIVERYEQKFDGLAVEPNEPDDNDQPESGSGYSIQSEE